MAVKSGKYLQLLWAIVASVCIGMFIWACSEDDPNGDGDQEYTINYDTDGGTPVQSQTAKAGTAISLPSTTKPGHNFTGWHTARIGGTLVGMSGQDYTVRGNTTLYARWTDGITIPDEPPVVSGGELTKGGYMENNPITADNLEDFIDFYLIAISAWNNQNNASRSRSSRSALPQERWMEFERGRFSYIHIGDVSGRVETVEEMDYIVSATGNSPEVWEGYMSETLKFFDYSNADSLFLGGSLGILETFGEGFSWDSKRLINKYNGTIEFAGKFRGKIVFDNVVHLLNTENCRDVQEDNSWEWRCDTTKNEVSSGRFYIESNGAQINLSPSLLRSFSRIESRERKSGNNNPIDTTMPAVPSAPTGMLNNRGGETVNVENIHDFFDAYISEMRARYDDDYSSSSNNGDRRAPRSGNDDGFTGGWEYLDHGADNGYLLEKGNDTWRRNVDMGVGTQTKTVEYFDYSNVGTLYLGGGFGRAIINVYQENNNNDREEYRKNGRINFNGEFRGTLDIQNLHYTLGQIDSITWRLRYRVISGRVMIGSLDVTEQYVSRFLNNQDRPNDPGTNGIINGAAQLNLSGQVWAETYNHTTGNFGYIQFNGNRNFHSSRRTQARN